MSFTLWLSAEEEQMLSTVMRAEGARTKQQAIVAALRDKAQTVDGVRTEMNGEAAQIRESVNA